MSKERVFDAILLSLTIAYAVTKAVATYQHSIDSSERLESIEDIWDDCFDEN